MQRQQFADRCRGALLGTALGDLLGAPVEGWTASEIQVVYGHPPRPLELLAASGGRYTDDTQMTLATLRSLLRCAAVDGADCARSCAAAFDADRRYGRSATAILTAIRDGADPRRTARLLFPQGSWGNGAAMRIAPVGLYCGHLPPQQLRPRIADAVCATHDHPEAVDAALVQAMAIGHLSRVAIGQPVQTEHLMKGLIAACDDAALTFALQKTIELLQTKADALEAAEALGRGVRSSESVPLALFVALRYLDDPTTALRAAVGCGGDTDTVAAMTGALVGALNGADCFPAPWHAALERGANGYDALLVGADALAGLVVQAGLFVDFYGVIG
jgi:poly(ADP-ribose) glycohydrolase ARH3